MAPLLLHLQLLLPVLLLLLLKVAALSQGYQKKPHPLLEH
jgi:hypothetical protein